MQNVSHEGRQLRQPGVKPPVFSKMCYNYGPHRYGRQHTQPRRMDPLQHNKVTVDAWHPVSREGHTYITIKVKQVRSWIWMSCQLLTFEKKIYNRIVRKGFLPWEILTAFPGESQLRQSHATQPRVHAGCFSVSIIHQTLTWTTASLRCAQMLMHAIAHRGVWTPYESLHWKLTWGENSLAAAGNWTCIGGVPLWCSANWAPSPVRVISGRWVKENSPHHQ